MLFACDAIRVQCDLQSSGRFYGRRILRPIDSEFVFCALESIHYTIVDKYVIYSFLHVNCAENFFVPIESEGPRVSKDQDLPDTRPRRIISPAITPLRAFAAL